MTLTEFRNEFNIFYNSIDSNVAPSVNDYELSVFLTEAQKQLIVGLYNGNVNQESFETVEEQKRYLSKLNVRKVLDFTNTETREKMGFDSSDTELKKELSIPKSLLLEGITHEYQPLQDYLFITLESCDLKDDDLCGGEIIDVEVLPTKQEFYHRMKKNPFRGPSSNKIIRLDYFDKINLISKYKISKYKVNFLRNPNPIIISDLDGEDSEFDGLGLSIEGKTKASNCELEPSLHRTLVQLAAKLAQQTYMGNMQIVQQNKKNSGEN